MPEEQVPLGNVVCPKCGWRTSFAYKLCLKCGVPMISVDHQFETRDRWMVFGIGGISLVITGYFVIMALLVTMTPRVGPHSSIDQGIAAISAIVVTMWLWGPPLLAVAIGDPRSKKQGVVVSPWRLFWQMQGIMYAISIAFSLLCLATCATR